MRRRRLTAPNYHAHTPPACGRRRVNCRAGRRWRDRRRSRRAPRRPASAPSVRVLERGDEVVDGAGRREWQGPGDLFRTPLSASLGRAAGSTARGRDRLAPTPPGAGRRRPFLERRGQARDGACVANRAQRPPPLAHPPGCRPGAGQAVDGARVANRRAPADCGGHRGHGPSGRGERSTPRASRIAPSAHAD